MLDDASLSLVLGLGNDNGYPSTTYGRWSHGKFPLREMVRMYVYSKLIGYRSTTVGSYWGSYRIILVSISLSLSTLSEHHLHTLLL